MNWCSYIALCLAICPAPSFLKSCRLLTRRTDLFRATLLQIHTLPIDEIRATGHCTYDEGQSNGNGKGKGNYNDIAEDWTRKGKSKGKEGQRHDIAEDETRKGKSNGNDTTSLRMGHIFEEPPPLPPAPPPPYDELGKKLLPVPPPPEPEPVPKLPTPDSSLSLNSWTKPDDKSEDSSLNSWTVIGSHNS